MALVEEFALWLKRWFSDGEIRSMLGDWTVMGGVKFMGRCIMNIEEFLQLAASFAAEKALGKRGLEVKVVAKYNEVYAFDSKTRTLLIAATYRSDIVSAALIDGFLSDMVRQAEEARDLYMSVRCLVE
ncbi:hypothetical protein KEJ24_02455 [Candidatus Bathyarchaeota archaeon]|nr:hypothetical protein [Candidatus Bathyarchaeota archaeon]